MSAELNAQNFQEKIEAARARVETHKEQLRAANEKLRRIAELSQEITDLQARHEVQHKVSGEGGSFDVGDTWLWTGAGLGLSRSWFVTVGRALLAATDRAADEDGAPGGLQRDAGRAGEGEELCAGWALDQITQ